MSEKCAAVESDCCSSEDPVARDSAGAKVESVRGEPFGRQQVNMETVGRDEYELLKASERRQEGKLVQLTEVYEALVKEKEHELCIANEKAKKLELALVGTEKMLTNMVRLQTGSVEPSQHDCSLHSVSQTVSGQAGSSCAERERLEELRSTSLPESLTKQKLVVSKLDHNVPGADNPTSSKTLALSLPPGTPSEAFDRVVRENLRLQKLLSRYEKANTISLDREDYEHIITKLKKDLTALDVELQEARVLLTLQENGGKDALAENLIKLQKEKRMLSKSVIAKAALLSAYNTEYARLKQAYNQLKQRVSEKDSLSVDGERSTEGQTGDGSESSDDAGKTKADEQMRAQQAKHTVQLERLETEKQLLRQENIRLQLLNKTCAESIEELCRTRRILDEQPMSMADMRRELEVLRNDKEMSAKDIEKYSHEIDELRAKMNGADSDRIKQKEYYDRQIMQLQKQCVQMASENVQLQRQLHGLTLHNRQLKYQLSRSSQIGSESDNAPQFMAPPSGAGIVVADCADEDELMCPRCDRTFNDSGKLESHKSKCMDS